MEPFKLHFPIKPSPKQRPRFDPLNGHAYTPDSTKHFEEHVTVLCRSQMNLAEREMLEGDVALDVTFNRHGHKRADIDNLLKSLMDGLTRGNLWRDDNQVVDVHMRVNYGAHANSIEVWVTDLGGAA